MCKWCLQGCPYESRIDDGKRSWAVDVIYFRAKPFMKGGLGGNRSLVWYIGIYSGSLFSGVFFSVVQISFSCILGVIWGVLGSLLGFILDVLRNSENWSPSCTKTIVLQIWRGPVWYLLAIFFEGYFLEGFFCVFLEFGDIWGVPLGACLETIFVFFSGSSTWGAQSVFWGGKSDNFGCRLEASGTNLGIFLWGFGVIWNTIK